MLFNSINFLLFFPFVVLLYFILPHKMRWVWLLIASYYFYMSWNPRYAILIAISTIITYLSGLLIDRANNLAYSGKSESRRTFLRKLWVALSFVLNLSILFFFKYFDFALDTINSVLQSIGMQTLHQPAFDILLPVGISFYTFQALSYTMDIYRGEIKVEKNIAKYALFVSFFPQLVAGPIERSKNLLKQISEEHYFDYERIKKGLLLMVWGYFQKIVVADNVSMAVNAVYNSYMDYSGAQISLATVLFAVQIYCDFAGYSAIAIGAAQVMGFRLMNNFKLPYFAISIQDFWHRWHISLSTWFRDYLYIPLGGSRCSKSKKYRNIAITFIISGLWHGANWTFVIWGALHGFYQIIGDILKPLKKRLISKIKSSLACRLLKSVQIMATFILVDFAWIFFRAPSIDDALSIIKRIFFEFFGTSITGNSLFPIGDVTRNEFLLFIALPISILFLAEVLQTKISIYQTLTKQKTVVRWAAYYAILALIIGLGAFGENQFIYFQF